MYNNKEWNNVPTSTDATPAFVCRHVISLRHVMMPSWLKRSRLFKSRNNNGYLQLIGTACSLLFDTGQHIFFHFVQNSMEGAAFRLQVLLHPVGVCLVSQQKKNSSGYHLRSNLTWALRVTVPPSCPDSAWECRWSWKSPHSSWPVCGWSSAEIPEEKDKIFL